ncbi:MAG: response regulator [Lentisphaeraceae bacterium]|nr:response regulator [Lentisphaeraceae bacterium]
MKILIIDKDENSNKELKEILSACNDCVISTDEIEAINTFTKSMLDFFYFNVVLIDMDLDEIDGIRLVKILRRFEYVKGLHSSNASKIVMMSATPDALSVKSALAAGCNSFMIKPCTKEKLHSTLFNYGVKVYY